jgi:hypothetical protein
LEDVMKEGGETYGVGDIYVTIAPPDPQVFCTHRIHSSGGHVLWIVSNETGVNLENVEVTNFRRAGGGGNLSIQWQTTSGGGSSGPIPSWQRRPIRAEFDGSPGEVYDYDILINGVNVLDPQIEI